MDEEVRELKKTATYVMVVRKPTSSDSPPTKKYKSQGDPSKRTRVGKNKSKIEEALKSGKLEGPFKIVPPMTLQQLIDEILKNVSIHYENFEDKDQ